jgi:hypothetical protein
MLIGTYQCVHRRPGEGVGFVSLSEALDESGPKRGLARLREGLSICRATNCSGSFKRTCGPAIWRPFEIGRQRSTPCPKWLGLETFDRRAINRRLKQYAMNDEAWMC